MFYQFFPLNYASLVSNGVICQHCLQVVLFSNQWYEETRSYAHERHHLYVARGYETMPTPYPESTERSVIGNSRGEQLGMARDSVETELISHFVLEKSSD